MKRTALTVLITSILINLHGYAQQVNFSGNPAQLETFFSSVTTQTGYVFFYNNALLAKARPVNIQLKNVSLDSAMRAVIKNQPFSYSIQGKTIFISTFSGPATAESQSSPDLQKIRGRVTDDSGMPVAKASLTAAGKFSSAITNENGNFELDIHKGDSLIVSSIGYGKKVVSSNSTFLNIVLESQSSPLEQVVIGGNLFALKRKADISSVTIINSKTLESLPVTDISDIYRGLVPGTNSFSTGDQPQEFPALSIRGAGNETSLSPISVYVDGIEWAGGSGYLSTINKENIDRIEVLRGPESSTLYGTGSNGGIVQIFTKDANLQTNDFTVRASAGYIQSKWVSSSVFQQYYTIDKTIGFKNAAISAGGTYQTNGAYLPGGGEKKGSAHFTLKWDASRKLSAEIAGYYAGATQGESRSPLYDTCTHLSDSIRQYYGLTPRKLTNKEVEVHSYFAGMNLSYQLSKDWVHRLTLGYSQNDNHESPLAQIDSKGLTPDNFYQSLNRTTTLRYSNLLNLSDRPNNWAFHLMSGADYKNIFYSSRIVGSRGYIRSNDPANTNIGVFMQANPSYKNIYLTVGLRYDYNKLFKDNHSWNPRIGLTSNFEVAKIIIKPRISWGSGITAPSYTARYGYPYDGFAIGAPNPDIKPQQQSGFDYAVELFDRNNKFSGEVIYYNNVLKDIFVDNELPQDPNGLYVFQVTNLGSISNKGWEFTGRYNVNRRFSTYATFSIMHSVLKDTAGGYLSSQFAGKAPGYQLKYLPIHTAGLFLNYNFFKLFGKKDKGTISLNITEADGLLYPDILNWFIDMAYKRTPDNSIDLPANYWKTTPPTFRLGFHFEYDISSHFQFIAQGSNILNQNNTEIGTYNVTHGASWLFGFKYSTGK